MDTDLLSVNLMNPYPSSFANFGSNNEQLRPRKSRYLGLMVTAVQVEKKFNPPTRHFFLKQIFSYCIERVRFFTWNSIFGRNHTYVVKN